MTRQRQVGSWIVLGTTLGWLCFLPGGPLPGVCIQNMAVAQPECGKQPSASPVLQPEAILVISEQFGFDEIPATDILAVVRDCIRDESWGDAATALGILLRGETDHLIRVSKPNPDPKKTMHHWALVREEAYKLLNRLPPQGLKKYEEKFGKVPDPKQQKAIKPVILEGALSIWHEDRKSLKTLEKHLAYVTVTPQTKIWKHVGAEKQVAQLKDLQVGDTLKCLLTAPVLGPDLFPVQATEVTFYRKSKK